MDTKGWAPCSLYLPLTGFIFKTFSRISNVTVKSISVHFDICLTFEGIYWKRKSCNLDHVSIHEPSECLLSHLVSYEHSTLSNVHLFCYFSLLMHNYSHGDNLYSRATHVTGLLFVMRSARCLHFLYWQHLLVVGGLRVLRNLGAMPAGA
jgi:hypothetical protein